MSGKTIKHRCPLCKKKRRDPGREPPRDVGGEPGRPREKYWAWTPFGRFCGWCAMRMRGEGDMAKDAERARRVLK